MFLEVSTPFWQSVEFYCCLFTAVVVIVYATYRHRIKQMEKLQDVRQRIARDLHDEIGSTLSSISMTSRMAATGSAAGTERGEELFSTIGKASSQAMGLMSDIVWSVNPENDRMANVISRMREYASATLEAANISFRIETDGAVEKMTLQMEKRKDVYLIFKEAVNNLAKYSKAKEALLKFSVENNRLTLKIEDDGMGFSTDESFSGNGLKNMKSRAEQLHAVFNITSALNAGTAIVLTVPLS